MGTIDGWDGTVFRRVLVDESGRLITVLGPSSSVVQKGRVFNTAYGGAGVDVFAADLEVTNTPTVFRIIVCIDTATTIIAVRDDGTPAEVDSELNAGGNLVADAEYAFDVYMTDGETFNLEFGGACNINYLLVLEVPAMVS